MMLGKVTISFVLESCMHLIMLFTCNMADGNSAS